MDMSNIGLYNCRLAEIREIEWSYVRKFMFLSPPGRFLDVGCGNGYALGKAERLGFSAIGIDREIRTIQSTEWERTRSPNRSIMLEAISESLPFQSGVFDVVFSSHALEHFRNRDLALQEMIRVLGPNGRALFVVPTGTLAFIRLISCFLFTGVLRIGHFLKERSLRALREIVIPGPHGSYASSAAQELIDFSRKHWTDLLSKHLQIQDSILTVLYPFPDFPQLFPILKSRRYASSVVFVCKKLMDSHLVRTDTSDTRTKRFARTTRSTC
jgi:SAM-dependent methyltransferase